MNRTVITLLTDFGTEDSYVAQMKGVLLSRCPGSTLIDISHDVPPQDVALASRLLAEAVPRFPPKSVHLAVVDPGVGTDRAILAVQWTEHLLVLPDNGLLSDLDRRSPIGRVHQVSDRQLFNHRISPTFHGRDIMSPIAAFLASGGELEQVGPPARDVIRLPEVPEATERPDGGWDCRIISKDRFGNLLLSSNPMLRQAVCSGKQFQIVIADTNLPAKINAPLIAKPVISYGQESGGELVLLLDSQDRLELALVGGSAADLLNVTGKSHIQIYPV